jgi:hypothetical protein
MPTNSIAAGTEFCVGKSRDGTRTSLYSANGNKVRFRKVSADTGDASILFHARRSRWTCSLGGWSHYGQYFAHDAD